MYKRKSEKTVAKGVQKNVCDAGLESTQPIKRETYLSEWRVQMIGRRT